MPVRKPKDRPNYKYDFTIGHDGRSFRFEGSTGTSIKKQALEYERLERDKQYRMLRLGEAGQITLDAAMGRFLLEVAQHHRSDYFDMMLGTLDRVFLDTLFGRGLWLHEITDEKVAQYVAHRRQENVWQTARRKQGAVDRKVAGSTINKELRLLKKINIRVGEIWNLRPAPFNILKHLLPETKKAPFAFTPEQIQALLAECDTELAEQINFFLNTAVRLQNVTKLQGKHCDTGNRIFRFIVKGQKEHIVPMTEEMASWLTGKQLQAEDYVFCKKSGKPYATCSKTALKSALARSGLTLPRGSLFHAFRHTAATWMLANGVGVRTVQEILGHADIKTTMIYTHVQDVHKKGALEKLSAISATFANNGGKEDELSH